MAAKLSILVALFGTEGDMRPLLWFAHGMAARGHRITIHVNPHYREVADREGWPVLELGTADRFHEVMNDPRIWKPGEGTKLVLSTMIEALPMYQSSLDAARERFDLVVGTVLATGAMAWAEQNRIPRLLAYLQPMALRAFPRCSYRTPTTSSTTQRARGANRHRHCDPLRGLRGAGSGNRADLAHGLRRRARRVRNGRERMRHQHALPALCDFAEGLARQSSI